MVHVQALIYDSLSADIRLSPSRLIYDILPRLIYDSLSGKYDARRYAALAGRLGLSRAKPSGRALFTCLAVARMLYRGTSLIRNTPPLGTSKRTTYLGSFGGPRGGCCFL